MIVVDASVALAWSHKDERTPQVLSIAARVTHEGAIVPVLWPHEIANGLEMAVRRKRISVGVRDELLANFVRLDVTVERTTPDVVWGIVLGLAHRYTLTVYDATYLELALRLKLPLASLDEELIQAVRAEGVEVLP